MGMVCVKDSIAEQDYLAAVGWRRKLHQHAQPAWLEFFATGFVAEKFSGWGYDVKMGHDILDANKLLLLPNPAKLEEEYQRALQAGIEEKYLAPAKGGMTGVVATLKGKLPGPVVAFRFDIDSNEVSEASDPEHIPARESFASQNPSYAHMCGHDVHAATGLLLAKWFADNRDELCGSVKFIFQPNEENLSGAAAMVSKGIVDDVDYMLGGHVGTAARQLGQIACNVRGILALSRFEVTFTGRPTHAAASPQEGKNALLGACAAVANLHGIARHAEGATTVNVGYLQAGTTWNVVPEKAYFQMETRGVTTEINEYMARRAHEIIAGAAQMHDLGYEIKPAAVSFGGVSSPELVSLAEAVARQLPSVSEVLQSSSIGGSEDYTVFMRQVQERGGQALFLLFGTPTYGGHHNSKFDVDERVIKNAAEFYVAMHREIVATNEKEV